MGQPMTDILELIRACDAGDPAARRRFQDEYGEDIYYFPVKLHGLPVDKAGDFYVYVFDHDRLFTRLSTFEGREGIKFRNFLSFFVLKSLFLDWLRTLKEVDMVPLPDVETESSPRDHVSPDARLDSTATEVEPAIPKEVLLETDLWSRLSPEEQLDLKLLCLIECDLSLADARLLATRSGRPMRDTLLLLEEIRQKLRRKDEKLAHLQDSLDSVWGWILLRQKELKEIDEKIRLSMTETKQLDSLIAHRRTLENALEKRYRQREKLLEEMRAYKLTTPYSDLAQLLNIAVASVGSRIFRLRKRLGEEMGERKSRQEEGSQ
jgi:RNA polymerase sigma factor (sigma-70 family)